MIREFAVDPSLLTNWERFRYLTEKFGVPEGRLISRYPGKWPKMVYDGLKNVTEMDRKRIEEKLQEVKQRRMMKSKHDWDGELTWQQNAEAEQAARRFHATIVASNPNEIEGVLLYSELNDSEPPWKVYREMAVPRTADRLAGAVEPLLRISRKIVFVDPHFSPTKPKAMRSLVAFLKCCRDLERLELHTQHKDRDDFQGQCLEKLGNHIPAGPPLKVIRWKEQETSDGQSGGEGLHNRYILTERGGIRMAWGLDEGKRKQTDDVSLLSDDLYARRWEDYCGDSPVFECVETFEVRRC